MQPEIITPCLESVDQRAEVERSSDAPSAAIMAYWGSFMAQSNGSHARAIALLEFLRRSFDSVTLYSYAEHPEEPWTEAHRRAFAARFPDVALVLDRETRWLRIGKKAKEVLVTLFPAAAPAILAFALPGQAPGYARLRQKDSAVFVLNYVDGLARINGAPCDRTVVETHDVKFLKRAKIRNGSPTSLVSLIRMRNEIASLTAPAGVIAISLTEAAFYRMMLGSERVFCASIYDGGAPEPGAGEEYEHDMLFAASENPLNERGILRFLDENGDWISRWRIALCGRICERPAVRDRAALLPNLELLGFVNDLPALYRRSRLCLSPTDGTGLKIKVIQALRHGKPVLASPPSMDGLPPGYDACVLPIERRIAERLLCDEATLAAAQTAARDYYAAVSGVGDQARLTWFLKSLSRCGKGIVS